MISILNWSPLLLLVIAAPELPSQGKYVFYLHGAVLEGTKPGDGIFQEYRYDDILNAFRKGGFTVESEIRKSGSPVTAYAREVANRIEALLQKGVPADHITIVGGSKGALIGMYVSTYLKNRDINFVFLAACNEGNFQSNPEIIFYGNILSIYEKSDGIGESCKSFRDKGKTSINHYKEIEIHTGLGHQFLWNARPEWIKPAIEWAQGTYE